MKTVTGGYTLRVQGNAIVNHLSISGLMVMIGLWFTATKVNEEFLVGMFLDKEKIRKQQICELDLTKYMKDD